VTTRASSSTVVRPEATFFKPSCQSGTMPSSTAWRRTASAPARSSTSRRSGSVMSMTSCTARRPRYPVAEQAWHPTARWNSGVGQPDGQRASDNSTSLGS
jgi:hypothetical protein